MIDGISLALVIVGAINWGLVGIFDFDLVSYIAGGPETIVARTIYTVIAIAGLWCISLFFKDTRTVSMREKRD